MSSKLEAIKNIRWTRGEDAVDRIIIARGFKNFWLSCKNLDNQRQVAPKS